MRNIYFPPVFSLSNTAIHNQSKILVLCILLLVITLRTPKLQIVLLLVFANIARQSAFTKGDIHAKIDV